VIDPIGGEEIFNRLKLLKFPSLRPVRTRNSIQGINQRHFETEIEAVLHARPGFEPDISTELHEQKHEELRIAVEDMFNQLTEEEQWIYHMLVDIGLSMRFVARALNMPKTTFARRRDALADKMRKLLLEHKIVRDKLGL
jgi:DNA-directed RNA polymerase specialized sigma subunit